MPNVIHELKGGNMDIDLVDPAPWPQDKCPWNLAEGTHTHRCAIKNVSICKYFEGVKDPDIILCTYNESS